MPIINHNYKGRLEIANDCYTRLCIRVENLRDDVHRLEDKNYNLRRKLKWQIIITIMLAIALLISRLS
jgi:NADH:ubiquinone oxidoreductase subunit D